MKTLFALLMLITSLTALAQQYRLSDYPLDPNYCGKKQSCVNGYIPLLRSGSYFARGYGRTCEQAMEDSEDVFVRAHGNLNDCGLVSGPYSWTCYRSPNGRFVSYHQCNPDSGSSSGRGSRSRCAMVFGRLVC